MTTLFLKNLPYQASEAELRRAFERFGRVSSVRMPLNRLTGQPSGFAFVAMPSYDDADEAMTRMNGATMGGRTLIVNEARARDRLSTEAQQPNVWDQF